MTQSTRHTCALAALPAQLADRIELIPVGTFKTADKRPAFTLADVAQVIADSIAVAAGGILPIDFDHGTDRTGDSRAAGWITGMEVEGDRVMASVEWTPDGRRAVEEKTYRFISPVFKTRPDGRVVLIERAGLVNVPALPQLRQLASKENDMDRIAFAGLLGLTADQADTLEGRVTALLAAETQLASILKASGVAEGAEAVTQICAKLANPTLVLAQPDPAKFVPIDVVTGLQTQLASLQTAVNGDKVEGVLEAARASGKIAPGMEDWARQYASKDLAGFTAWAGASPQIMTAGRLVTGIPQPVDATGLSKEERQICAMMGQTEADFIATRTLAKKEA